MGCPEINSPEVGSYGVGHVKAAEGLGCRPIRVFDPEEIYPALEKAKVLGAEYKVPVVVEVILQPVTNVSIGLSIAGVTEFEELAADAQHAPTAVLANLECRVATVSQAP